MFFSINFTFLDEKTFSAVVDEPNLKRFLNDLSKGDVYWDQEGGFWLAWSQIRYIQIKEIKNQIQNEQEIPDPIAY